MPATQQNSFQTTWSLSTYKKRQIALHSDIKCYFSLLYTARFLQTKIKIVSHKQERLSQQRQQIKIILSKKFWEKLIAYFPLIRYVPHRKRRFQKFFVSAGTCLSSRCLAAIGGYTDITTDSPLIWQGPHGKWRVQQFFCCCVYPLPQECFFRSCCLATIHIQTCTLMGVICEVSRWDELRCHDIHTKFHKDWFWHSKLIGGIHRHRDTDTNAAK
jgi:hypothetical protein